MYGSTSANQNTDTTCIATQPTTLMMYGYRSANQNHQSTGMATPITSMSESLTFPRTTLPAETTPSLRQSTHEIHQKSSHSGPPTCCIHVHRPQSQAGKPGDLPALKKVKIPHNGKTSMNRSPLTKQEIPSQFSGCFEGIGHFRGDLCKFHLKSDHQPARHASEEVNTEKVNTYTDWVHSYRERMEHARHLPAPMEMCMDDHLTQTTERTQRQHLQDKTYEQNCLTHNTLPDFTFRHAEFPPGMESTPIFPGKQFQQGNEASILPDMENTSLPREPVPTGK